MVVRTRCQSPSILCDSRTVAFPTSASITVPLGGNNRFFVRPSRLRRPAVPRRHTYTVDANGSRPSLMTHYHSLMMTPLGIPLVDRCCVRRRTPDLVRRLLVNRGTARMAQPSWVPRSSPAHARPAR